MYQVKVNGKWEPANISRMDRERIYLRVGDTLKDYALASRGRWWRMIEDSPPEEDAGPLFAIVLGPSGIGKTTRIENRINDKKSKDSACYLSAEQFRVEAPQGLDQYEQAAYSKACLAHEVGKALENRRQLVILEQTAITKSSQAMIQWAIEQALTLNFRVRVICYWPKDEATFRWYLTARAEQESTDKAYFSADLWRKFMDSGGRGRFRAPWQWPFLRNTEKIQVSYIKLAWWEKEKDER